MVKNIGLVCEIKNAERTALNLVRFGYQIKALWTPEMELSLQLAATFEIPFTANEYVVGTRKPDEVVLRKDVELLVIDCKPSLRSHVALSALGIGKHIVCSSPVGLTVKDTSNLLEASNYYPQLSAFVAYDGRLRDIFITMRRLVKEVGSPLACEFSLKCKPLHSSNQYDWTWERTEGGGILNIIGCHVIDLIAFVLDMKATKAYGLTLNFRKASSDESIISDVGLMHRSISEAEDFASFLLKFAEEACATVVLNASPYAHFDLNQVHRFEQTFTISGPHGTIRATNHDRLQQIIKRNDHFIEEVMDFSSGANEISSSSESAIPYEKALLITCQRLSDNQNSDKFTQERVHATFEDARYVRTVIDAIKKSSSGDGWTKVV